MSKSAIRWSSCVTGLVMLAASCAAAAQEPRVPTLVPLAIDARLAEDAGLHVGDHVVIAGEAGSPGDSAVITAIVQGRADPSEIARADYRARLHLGDLQRLLRYGDRVDRFAVATGGGDTIARSEAEINNAAFGFRAYRSRDIAVQTSATFRVVSRFHRAIGVITIVASAIFLLCILLLKVEERRRDVAALRLIGISRRTVMRAVVLEAACVALLGSAMGGVIGWATSALVNWHYQGVYRTPLRFAIVTPDILLFATTLSLLLGVGAGALAALRLVRTPPLALLGR